MLDKTLERIVIDAGFKVFGGKIIAADENCSGLATESVKRLSEIVRSDERERIMNESRGQPIETAPENTEILCYSEYEPHYFVARFKWESEYEDILVSESGNRRTYETRETKVRNWGDSESYGAHYWMPIPKALNGSTGG